MTREIVFYANILFVTLIATSITANAQTSKPDTIIKHVYLAVYFAQT